ncbi:unnamed protein product [Brachionus calyciflorus]|uniref:Uncharacterized protein n=1 Tax=Brachionus calyciflorus TaxID=104777 RepID=A0A813V9N5_9BILA|nr:unnamed protein product [Brachionus calyciflorus]
MLLILIQFVLFKASLALFSLECQEKCSIDHSFNSFCYKNAKISRENLKSCYFEHSSNKNSIFNIDLINLNLNDNYPLDLNYLSNLTQKININGINIEKIPVINNLNNLLILKINFHSIFYLENDHFFPPSLEIIDLAEGPIYGIKKDFFVKFENLKEINLYRNKVKHIDMLEINSNFIRLIDFSSQKANSLNYFGGIYFHKNKSDSKLIVNFDSNRIYLLPKIQGQLRHIYYYKIGHQFDQVRLINRDFITLSDDGTIEIENFEIYDQHFSINKDHTGFQCLLDYGVIKNVVLTGQTKKKYKHHTMKKDLNFEKCNKYVSKSIAATAIIFTKNNILSSETLVYLVNDQCENRTFILFKSSFASFPKCQEKCTDDSSFSFCYTNGTLSSEHLKSCYFEHFALKDSRIINFELFYVVLSQSKETLDLNYLSEYTQKIHINKMNIGSLPKINNLYNLKTLKINFHEVGGLLNNENLPINLEIIDLSDGDISRIHDEFFIKFENLRELNLRNNRFHFLKLEINSNFIKLIDLSYQNDPNLFINFDSNRINTLPMILGNLRHIYYYKIGHQFYQEQLLKRNYITLSDGPIVIENFEISYQHFIKSKVLKHFQCLLDYGVIRNVILTGDGKEEYLNHTIKKNFNLENCKNFVSTSTAPIKITTSSTKNKTINLETLISTTFVSEISFLNSTTPELNKIGEKQSSKIDYSFRNRILDYFIDNPGVVVSILTFLFLFLLMLFACFDCSIENNRSKGQFQS